AFPTATTGEPAVPTTPATSSAAARPTAAASTPASAARTRRDRYRAGRAGAASRGAVGAVLMPGLRTQPALRIPAVGIPERPCALLRLDGRAPAAATMPSARLGSVSASSSPPDDASADGSATLPRSVRIATIVLSVMAGLLLINAA